MEGWECRYLVPADGEMGHTRCPARPCTWKVRHCPTAGRPPAPARRRASTKVREGFSASPSLKRFEGCDYDFGHCYHAFLFKCPADELQPDGKTIEEFRVVWSARDYYFSSDGKIDVDAVRKVFYDGKGRRETHTFCTPLRPRGSGTHAGALAYRRACRRW